MANRNYERESRGRERLEGQELDRDRPEGSSHYDWAWDRSFNRQASRGPGSYYQRNFGPGYRQQHARDRDFDRGGDDHHRGENRAPNLPPYGEDFDPGDSFDWQEVENRQIRDYSFDRPYRQPERDQNRQRHRPYPDAGNIQRVRRSAQPEERRERWDQPGPYRGIGPETYRHSDERIAEEICERLTRHGQIDARNIDIEVKEGEVTLKGHVRRKLEKYAAEDAVESISGVKDIQNKIRVESQRLDQRTGGGIQTGMEVISRDGDKLGTILEIRAQDFRLGRSPRRDIFVPFSAIVSSAEQVKLNVPANQIENRGWEAG